jgi:hypothetical protein
MRPSELVLALCAVAAAAAAAAAPQPPRISLDLAAVGAVHPYTLPSPGHPAITAGPETTAYGKTCEVLTSTAVTCAEPSAAAFDHHEGTNIDVVRTVILYIASDPRAPPMEVFSQVPSVDYYQRGEYILYYDAKDSSDNHAEQLAFGMIMQDTVPPVLTTWADAGGGAVTVEACDADVAGADADFRGLYVIDADDETEVVATDNYDDGPLDVNVTVTSPRGVVVKHAAHERVTIDTRVLGKWTVQFAAADFASIFGENSSSNTAAKTISIDVQDTTPPTIYCNTQRYLTTLGHFNASHPLQVVSDVKDVDACSAVCAAQRYQRVMGTRVPSVAACEYFEFAGSQCMLFTADVKAAFEAKRADSQHKSIASGWATLGANIACNATNKVECVRAAQGGFVDPGALCVDLRDSYNDLNGGIHLGKVATAHEGTSGAVDASEPGSYTVEYSCMDSTGLQADAVARVIEVVDDTAPTLVLKGNHEVQLGGAAEDAQGNHDDLVLLLDAHIGSTCTDTCDPASALKLSAEVYSGGCEGTFQQADMQTGELVTVTRSTGAAPLGDARDVVDAGVYGIKYSCEDRNGNVAALCRIITIEAPDTRAPTPVPQPTPAPLTPNPTPQPINCTMSAWGSWTSCNEVCGGGVRQRTRYVMQSAEHGGSACSTKLDDAENCNTRPCASCKYTFAQWTNCTRSCGDAGTRSRAVVVVELQENHSVDHKSGQPCPLAEQETCNKFPCPSDCVATSWGAWSTCTVTCNSGTALWPNFGTQKRMREVVIPTYHGGAVCPHLDEARTCSEHFCPIVCVIEQWSSWSVCSISCSLDGDNGGVQQRVRKVLRVAMHGAPACPITQETRKCNLQRCPLDCSHVFEPWMTCTKSCGSGVQRREVTVKVQAELGGKSCPVAMERTCNTAPCATDCVVAQWGAWSTCTKTCGEGSQQRTRTSTEPKFGGKACLHSNEGSTCNAHACPIDCSMGQWGRYSDCSLECGSGTKSRSRSTLILPEFGGKACESEQEPQNCNLGPCPVDCEHTWDTWSTCSVTCGDGKRTRSAIVVKPAEHNGKACPNREEEVCRLNPCPTTAAPTTAPTDAPTAPPTTLPTAAPTRVPTAAPTLWPTAAPTKAPTAAPTTAPTPATSFPTSAPTQFPSPFPTPQPTQFPTPFPTPQPTQFPTPFPTPQPTQFPTPQPTASPTSAPTAASAAPTAAPTLAPTPTPTPAAVVSIVLHIENQTIEGVTYTMRAAYLRAIAKVLGVQTTQIVGLTFTPSSTGSMLSFTVVSFTVTPTFDANPATAAMQMAAVVLKTTMNSGTDFNNEMAAAVVEEGAIGGMTIPTPIITLPNAPVVVTPSPTAFPTSAPTSAPTAAPTTAPTPATTPSTYGTMAVVIENLSISSVSVELTSVYHHALAEVFGVSLAFITNIQFKQSGSGVSLSWTVLPVATSAAAAAAELASAVHMVTDNGGVIFAQKLAGAVNTHTSNQNVVIDPPVVTVPINPNDNSVQTSAPTPVPTAYPTPVPTRMPTNAPTPIAVVEMQMGITNMHLPSITNSVVVLYREAIAHALGVAVDQILVSRSQLTAQARSRRPSS